MPRRSTGCYKCRQRKVRCDEGRPGCQKCADYGMECPGYRPPAEKDLHFIDQTRHIARNSGHELVEQQRGQSGAAEALMKKYRWRHQFLGEVETGSLSDINKRHVHRVQLLNTFLDLYLPRLRDPSMTHHFTYITKLPYVDLATPLLQISVDTLCLAELGSLYEDERCLQESRSRYVRALPMLANELAKPKDHMMRKDNILAVILILALCELFDAIARGNEANQGWISHVAGAQQYLQSHGLECMTTPFGWLLFHNVRHSSLCMGFAKRKKVFFAEPKWLKLTEDLAKTEPYIALYDMIIHLPGIFERFDSLSVEHNIPADYAGICRDICQLRLDLDEWLQTRYIDRGTKLYDIVDVRQMKVFAGHCLDRTFQTVFSFPSVELSGQVQLYWICCLSLDFTLLSIFRRFLDSEQYPLLRLEDYTTRTEKDIERDLLVNATNFCRGVPFLCQPETASVGRMGSFLLRLVESYFELFGHCRELEWCRAVRRMLQSNSGKPPKPPAEASKYILEHAPWNIEHRCRSPICNFKVECVAPAPILLTGEYPNKGYAHKSSKDQTENAFGTHNAEELLQSLRESLAIEVTSASEAEKSKVPRLYKRSGAYWLNIPVSFNKLNGASVLADELVIPEGNKPKIDGPDFEAIRWTKGRDNKVTFNAT